MDDPGEIERFCDRASELIRALLDELANEVPTPRSFPEVVDALAWLRRRVASVLGGVWHMRTSEFGGRRPYRFIDEGSLAIRKLGDLVRHAVVTGDPGGTNRS